jgi:hypothetical protein
MDLGLTNKQPFQGIKVLEGKVEGVSFVLFSVLFVTAQCLHPDLFEIEFIRSGEQWLEKFRGQSLLHIAHFLEFICGFLLMIVGLHLKKRLQALAPRLVTVAMIFVFIGSFMLVANKSALCLTISGFDTLPAEQLQQIIPALEVLLMKKGFLGALWLLPLLPIGFLLFSIALFKTKYVPRWQSVQLIIGSLLLANPEIEVINFFASFFLAAGLIPYGIKLLFFSNGKSKKSGAEEPTLAT